MSSFSDKFNEFKDKAEALADEAGDKLKEGWDSAKEAADGAWDKAKDALDGVMLSVVSVSRAPLASRPR